MKNDWKSFLFFFLVLVHKAQSTTANNKTSSLYCSFAYQLAREQKRIINIRKTWMIFFLVARRNSSRSNIFNKSAFYLCIFTISVFFMSLSILLCKFEHYVVSWWHKKTGKLKIWRKKKQSWRRVCKTLGNRVKCYE